MYYVNISTSPNCSIFLAFRIKILNHMKLPIYQYLYNSYTVGRGNLYNSSTVFTNKSVKIYAPHPVDFANVSIPMGFLLKKFQHSWKCLLKRSCLANENILSSSHKNSIKIHFVFFLYQFHDSNKVENLRFEDSFSLKVQPMAIRFLEFCLNLFE